MKKILILLISTVLAFNLQAQVKNVNPNPDGEPWIIGGWKSPTKKELFKIPFLKIDKKFKTKNLPQSLDNSTLPYFRDVFSQTDGSCAQASGVAYNFTYELNRARGTAANVAQNQFPTHYTYNFLNGGSGSNGSWYGDGWNIIKASGCPTVETYGGLAQSSNYWMSSYSDYESGMGNRIVEAFNIDVSTAEGLENLKYWLYNHADGSDDGGIVNFAAGISIDDYNITYDNIITKWGYSTNHAMTFVGWDDNISYDVNNDGQITNDIDITGDGQVDMKDWEKGAMIMVNSWGTSWGDNGKAYVMYRLLALPVSEGGIGASNVVSSILVRPEYDEKMKMRIKMEHSCRNKIKIVAGISSDVSANEPEYSLSFPLFNYQGGEYYMRGNNSSPIEFSLDISPLLSYIESGEDAKFFLQVYENDEYNSYNGTVNSFSVVNSSSEEFNSLQTDVSIVNNDVTTLSVVGNAVFDAPEITTNFLADAYKNQTYSSQLEANGGSIPYCWNVLFDFSEQNITENYPNINSQELNFSNDDDGYAQQIIDFEFPFCGKFYDTLFIRTDGSIAFEPGFTYLRTEDAIISSKIISVFASDLMIYPAEGDAVYYEGDENSAIFRWKTSIYDQPYLIVDVAVKLFPDGKIQFFYNNTSNGLTWASGLSNNDGMNYYITSYSGNNDPTGTKVEISGSNFPQGMSLSEEGIFSGTPANTGNWDINFACKDFDNIFSTKQLQFTVVEGSKIIAKDNSKVKIYPNPADDFIYILTNFDRNEEFKIKIHDLNGKIMYKYDNIVKSFGKNVFYIDLKNFKSGVYIISIEGKDLIKKKFIVQ